MPLWKSSSKRAFKHNIRTEVRSGRPVKQSVAIAYSTQRRAAEQNRCGCGTCNASGMGKHLSADAKDFRYIKKEARDIARAVTRLERRDSGMRKNRSGYGVEITWDHKTASYNDPSAAHEKALRLQSMGAKSIVITPKKGKYVITWMEQNNRNRSGNFPDMYSGPMKRSSWGVMPSAKEWKTHFTYYVPGGIYPIRNARELKNRNGDFTSSELRALVKRLSQSPNEERMSLASGIMETLGFEWI